jgi:hypothetical protein
MTVQIKQWSRCTGVIHPCVVLRCRILQPKQAKQCSYPPNAQWGRKSRKWIKLTELSIGWIHEVPVPNLIPEAGYSDWDSLCFSSVSPGGFRGSTLKQGMTAPFQILSNSSVTYHTIFRSQKVSVTERASKNKLQININWMTIFNLFHARFSYLGISCVLNLYFWQFTACMCDCRRVAAACDTVRDWQSICKSYFVLWNYDTPLS